MNRKIDGRKKLTPFVLKKESLFVMLKTAFKHERTDIDRKEASRQ